MPSGDEVWVLIAPRERFSISSLPDLIRQSMREHRSLRTAKPFYSLNVSMDHRVIGE
jgi:hypothetical protein